MRIFLNLFSYDGLLKHMLELNLIKVELERNFYCGMNKELFKLTQLFARSCE